MGCIYYHILAVCCLFFFFSSRRRHTRLQGDWSSDVCSSDLMRGLANDDESIGNAKKIGTHVITAETIHLEGIGKVLSQIQIEANENVYITLDVDVMDPALAPGTGTLEPDGLNFSEINGLLKGVAKKGKLVGLDIVEVNPMRDPSGRTAQTAVRLLVDTLGEAFH